MRAYLLTVFLFNSRQGVMTTCIIDLLSLLYKNINTSKTKYDIKRSSLYQTFIQTMNLMIENNFINICEGEFDPNKFEQEFIVKLNNNKIRVKSFTNKTDASQIDLYTACNLKEFKEILSIPNISATKRIRLLYIFLYIKSLSYTCEKNITYSKCSYDKLEETFNMGVHAIRDYISVLVDTVCVKLQMKSFIISDMFGKEKFYKVPNIFMFKYDTYYEGMEKDVKRIENEFINDYLRENNIDRRVLNIND